MAQPAEDLYRVVLTDHAHERYCERVMNGEIVSRSTAAVDVTRRLRQTEQRLAAEAGREYWMTEQYNFIVEVSHEDRELTVVTVYPNWESIYGFDEPWILKLYHRALRKVMNAQW